MRILLLLVLLTGVVDKFSLAQFTLVLNGIVEDERQLPISDAKVILVDVATNVTRETKTDYTGTYRFTGVSAGSKYKMYISAPGFSVQELLVEPSITSIDRGAHTILQRQQSGLSPSTVFQSTSSIQGTVSDQQGAVV